MARLELEEGAIGGHPADGLHEVGELQHLGQLQAPLRLRRRALLLSLAPRQGMSRRSGWMDAWAWLTGPSPLARAGDT
jgi:hypothetical protein